MKKILITGKDSYIGTNFKKYLNLYPNDFYIEELDVRTDSWKDFDFSKFDVVYHVAGLAHSTPNASQKDLYYKVNTDLTYEVCKKAKNANVKQFVFMSSIIVYGSGKIGESRVITADTPLNPDNFYGDSKKQAEIKIKELEDDDFKIVILRPPMIYGPNSKGNYPLLSKLSRKTFIFPNIENERSVLYLGNLLEFIRLLINNEERGTFFPQNLDYVSSKAFVEEISKVHKHKVLFTSLFNPLIKFMKKEKHINKLFGNLTIDKEISSYKTNYNIYSFKESIEITEKQ